jgi:hypothetical protein
MNRGWVFLFFDGLAGWDGMSAGFVLRQYLRWSMASVSAQGALAGVEACGAGTPWGSSVALAFGRRSGGCIPRGWCDGLKRQRQKAARQRDADNFAFGSQILEILNTPKKDWV